MKRFVAMCLTVCLLVIPLSAYATEEDRVLGVVNCESWVSLREEPSTRSKRLAKLPKGALVTYNSRARNGFAFVRYGKQEGYVLDRYLEPQNLAMVVGNCSEYATLRERASVSARTIMKLPKGTTVLRVDDVGNGFFRVCYNGKYGYVLSKYLLKAEIKSGTPKRVANCQSFISLRKAPSVKSDRLVKIPLGAQVTSFGNNGYGMEYVCYDGKYGFALSKYLMTGIQLEDMEDKIERFPFEGEISDAMLLEKGKVVVYEKPGDGVRKVGEISAPNIIIMGESYGASSPDVSLAENLRRHQGYSRVRWWDPRSNTIRSGFVNDSELAECSVSSSTEWNFTVTGYIGETIKENVKLHGGPQDDAVSVATLKKGSHLYILGSEKENWLYVSTYPFSSYLDANKSQEMHSEGWIKESFIKIVGKW